MELNDLKVKIQLLEGGKLPTKATEGSAGWDLYAAADCELEDGEPFAVPLGIKVQLPSDVEMQIRSRSGLSLKGITVANSPGTIDSDYRGEVKVILRLDVGRTGAEIFRIKKGDRIAQAVFAWVPKLSVTQVDSLDETERGSGGFGSTGK